MEHKDSPVDQKTVEGSPDTRTALWPDFEKPVTERPRVRKAQIRTVLHEQFDKPRVVGEDIRWPRLYISEHPRVEPIVGRHFASIEMCDLWRKRALIFSVRRSEMRHLVCIRLHEGRASRGARDIVTTGRVSRQTVEPIDKAQHIRHEYVGDGEGFG